MEENIIRDNPNIYFTDIAVVAVDLWRNLDPIIKQQYNKLADYERVQYNKEIALLNELLIYLRNRAIKYRLVFNQHVDGFGIIMTLQSNNTEATMILRKPSSYSFYYKINYNVNDDNDYIENIILFDDFDDVYYLVVDVINLIIPPSIYY